jgi:hypothetical protein
MDISARLQEPVDYSVRPTGMHVRWLLLVIGWLLAVVAAGCGQAASSTRPTNGVSPAPVAATQPASYEVVAPVLHLNRVGKPMACLTFLQSLPPAGCGGVAVTGYDFTKVPGLVRFADMGWQTPPLRLIGTWDGHALTVTSVSPAAASAQSEPGPPKACDGSRETAASRALARAITRAHLRIKMLELSPCREAAWVLVAVADQSTISYIRDRFGDRVIVKGWLRPS